MNHSKITAITAVVAVICTCAIAHVGDLKARDLLPPVYGPVFTAGEGGVAGESFASNGVQLKSWFPLDAFAGTPTSGNDCWGYISRETGREYAIIGLSNGTAFVEVSDPANAQIVAHITGPTSLWRCVKVHKKYAYVGSEGGGGIQVISLANIDGQIAGQPRVQLTGSVTAGGTQATHTLFIDNDSGYMYRAGGGSNGLRIYDLNQSQTAPPLVGSWSDVYVHEVQVVTYTTGPYIGKQIAFCCGGANSGHLNTGVYIVDVTNKAAPVQLSYTTYPNARFCHQSWLSADARRIYINDEMDEGASVDTTSTIVMNVANLAAPFVENIFTNGNPAVGHNLYIDNGKLFAANYRSGMRVYDLTADAFNPPEIAYFDTWPGDDAPTYNGLWNIWPYFPSGTVIGSDINRGLFVWRLGTSPGEFTYPNGLPTLVSPSGAPVTVRAVPVPGGGPLPTDSVHMRVQVDGSPIVVPMAPIGGDLYRGMFPPIACTTPFTYGFELHVGGEVYADSHGVHSAVSAVGQVITFDDSCESVGGWLLSAPGDTASSGMWVNADPVGTGAQPEDDHTLAGSRCFVTGNGPIGGAVGAADVDSGITTLRSPVFAADGDEAYVTYWRWYSNDQGNAPGLDSMPVSISNDGGATWVELELVNDNANAWVKKTFRVGDYVTPTATMRLRFVARDIDAGSVVEAAVDDVQVFTFDCTPATLGDINGDGIINGADLGALLQNWNLPGASDLNGDGTTNGSDLGLLLAEWN